MTDENGKILKKGLKTMASVNSVVGDRYYWDGFKHKVLNIHDIKLGGKVVEQHFWLQAGNGMVARRDYGTPTVPNGQFGDVNPKYVKITPEQKEYIALVNNLDEAGATTRWNDTLYKQHRALEAAPRYFLTDENGKIILYDLLNLRSIESELKYAGRVNFGHFSGRYNGIPKIINVHDLKLKGKVVEQHFWVKDDKDKYSRSSFNPDNPNDYIQDVNPKYVKTTPEQKEYIAIALEARVERSKKRKKRGY